MAISFGPKLGLINNANINEVYYDPFRPFLQAIDALLFANVINSTTVVPPASPNDGDAYLLIGTPSGIWTGHQFSIAVWDVQVTNSGTNTRNPQWVFYAPNPGWTLWNIATSQYLVYDGSAWVAVGGGANFPVNTDITSMTAILGGATTPGILITGTTTSGGGSGITLTGPDGSTAISVTDGIHSGGITYDGTGFFGGINCSGNIVCGSVTCSSNMSINTLSNGVPGQPVAISQAGGGVTCFVVNGAGTLYTSMLGFTNYPTQTTVGATGGASSLPATPLGYIPISVEISGTPTTVVVPYYSAT